MPNVTYFTAKWPQNANFNDTVTDEMRRSDYRIPNMPPLLFTALRNSFYCFDSSKFAVHNVPH